MSETDHLSFANPTVTEAVCEIYFALPKNAAWKKVYPGRFFKEIQSEYPEMEVDQQGSLQLELGLQGDGPQLTPIPPRTRYTHGQEQKLLQLAENILTINILTPYPGWRSVRQTVAAAWSSLVKVVRPSTITRMGLRYINQIRLQDSSQPGSIWLKPSYYVPAAIVDTLFPSSSRVDVFRTEHDKIIVNVARGILQDSQQHVLLFDIDRIVQRQISIQEEVLLEEMEHLHSDVLDTFLDVKTETLDRYLKKKFYE